MPLVTITCQPPIYPQGGTVCCEQDDIVSLASQIPVFMAEFAAELFLEEGTPANAVQVDIKRFSAFAVNVPDVWVHIWYTETPAEEERLQLREILKNYFSKWRADSCMPECDIAVDVAYGPTNGFLSIGGEELSW